MTPISESVFMSFLHLLLVKLGRQLFSDIWNSWNSYLGQIPLDFSVGFQFHSASFVSLHPHVLC